MINKMSRNLNEIASELSHAWLQAISTFAGGKYQATSRTTDNLGIDAEVKFQGKLSPDERALRFVNVNFQLKSTYSIKLNQVKDCFPISLDSDQYNKYVEMSKDPGNLFIMAVLVLPPEDNFKEWLTLDPESLILKNCMFWTSLAGLEKTDNQSGKNITILTKNRLTPQSLLNEIVIPFAEGRFGNEF